MNNLKLHVESQGRGALHLHCLGIPRIPPSFCVTFYACKYTSKNPCDLIEAVPLLRAASNLVHVSEECHSTSNDDDYYTDMPDLLYDDEETDDEESVYQS